MNNEEIIRVFVFNDTRSTNHYGCWRVMNNLEELLRTVGLQVVGTKSIIKKKQAGEILPDLSDIDLVVVNGEGTIHHDESRPRARFLIDLPFLIKEKFSCPVALVNSTISDLSPNSVGDLSCYDYLAVRDRGSKEYLDEHGVYSEYVPDLAFYNSPKGEFQVRDESVAVTDSVDEHTTDILRRYAEDRKGEFKEMGMTSDPGGSIIKNCFVHPVKTLKAAKARKILSSFEDRYLEFVGKHKSIIAGRYHAVIYAILMNVPFLAVSSNTKKIEFLLDDVFGSRSRCVGVGDIDKFEVPEFDDPEKYKIKKFLEISDDSHNVMAASLKSLVG